MEKIKNILDATGLPVAYLFFKNPPLLPYIVYFFTKSENFNADNKVYKVINNYVIELYTELKDIKTEKLLENILDKNEIIYDKSEVYINSENMYQVIYEIQI